MPDWIGEASVCSASSAFGASAGSRSVKDTLWSRAREASIANALVAKVLPDIALERLHAIGDKALAIDLEQQVRPATKIEAEHHLPLRQP